MVSRDEIREMRDKILDMSYSASVAYLTGQLPEEIAKKLTAGAAGWIISQLPVFKAPNLTKLELDSIAEAAGIGDDGVATRRLKIVSCTTYTSSGMPVMMNTYEPWKTATMSGQKYYRGEFSSSTTPMWR